MTTAQIALSVIMIIASLFLIVVVLLQEGAQQGLGAIEGGADTVFGKGKARHPLHPQEGLVGPLGQGKSPGPAHGKRCPTRCNFRPKWVVQP